MRLRFVLALALGASFASGAPTAAAAGNGYSPGPSAYYSSFDELRGAGVEAAQHHDRSRPLREIAPLPPPPADRQVEKRVKRLPQPLAGPYDPVVQTQAPSAAAPTAGLGFDGIGNGILGFTVNYAPPDTNGAVGSSYFVQIVNTAFAVFDKATGAAVYGPAATNTLWSGFGGGCETNNDGDATVVYDKAAARWVISQFSVSTTPYLQCVAVSQTSNPTGAYYRYAFSYGNVEFPDYPKLGVWGDGYYETFNIFDYGRTFAGPKTCAYDRTSMLAGAPATQQCFQLSTAYGGLLPSDIDGSTAPPLNSPAYIMDSGTNELQLWKFHVDWSNAANTTLTGPAQIPAAAFTPACNGGNCVPQPGTHQLLDSLGDRLMYRLAYRNLGDHEALVVNQSVDAGSGVIGVRWYEVRGPSSAPTIYQQGTYAPADGVYRWMGSVAMDHMGDIGLGFSASSSSLYPSLRYTGRLFSDPLGTLTQGESTLVAGTGSQLRNLARWGDYSSIGIDPVDDCTFWFTSEYLKTSGTFNWNTKIGSFKLPGCNATPPPAAPTGVAATVNGASVALSWTASATATSYKVYRGTTAGGEGSTPIATGIAGTAYTDSGVASGATYFYKVVASNAGGDSPASNEASATLAPAAPTGLTATPADRSVALSWTASGGATSYKVYRGTTAGGEGPTPIATATGPSFNDSGLTNGTPYYYKVVASNTGGDSPASSEASATPNLAPPAAPTGLTATAGNGSVALSWAPTAGATGYKVLRGTTPNGESATPVATPTASSFTDTGVTNGTTYYYKVIATNGAGDSPASSEVSATPQPPPPPAPTGLTATAGNGSVALSWTAPGGATSYYKVLRGTTAGGESSTPIATPTATSYTDTAVTNGTTYYYKVIATNGGGDSPASSEASATPAAPPVNTVAPSISGPPNVGQILTANPGTWTGTAPITYTYAWQSCTSLGGSCGPGVLGTNQTYTIQPADQGSYIQVIVTAANSAGSASQTAPGVGPVTASPIANGGFETGALAPWQINASNPAPSVTTTAPHTGTYSALAGFVPSTGEPTGDSTYSQQFTVPATGSLSFWVWRFTTDWIQYDWQECDLITPSGTKVVFKTADNSQTWQQYTVALDNWRGLKVTISCKVHEDGWGDQTYMRADDFKVG